MDRTAQFDLLTYDLTYFIYFILAIISRKIYK